MTDKPSPPPPERHTTPRQALLAALCDIPRTARELSPLAGLAEKEIYGHLEHLQRSHAGLKIEVASCLKCGFRFEKRGRLNKPGHCPLCKSTRIDPPRFSLS